MSRTFFTPLLRKDLTLVFVIVLEMSIVAKDLLHYLRRCIA